MANILVVDDDPQIVTALSRGLTALGHEVAVARTGTDAISATAVVRPDVVLLDLRLPDVSGIDVVHRLRGWTQTPVLLLSGAGTQERKIASLDAGADDFVDKPFSLEELRARIDAALRRSPLANGQATSSHLVVGELEVDMASRRLLVGGDGVHLTPIEWRLLEVFLANAGKILTYATIIGEVWSREHGDEARSSLRVHVRSLRRKLADDASTPRYIATEPGAGYRWVGGVPA